MLELYEKLKPKLGEEEARALLEFIEASVERRAATREDLQGTEIAVREDLRKTETALREEIEAVREDLRKTEIALREEIQAAREDMRKTEMALREEIQAVREDLQRVRGDLIKWTFAFWVGTIAVLTGIMFTLLRAFTT